MLTRGEALGCGLFGFCRVRSTLGISFPDAHTTPHILHTIGFADQFPCEKEINHRDVAPVIVNGNLSSPEPIQQTRTRSEEHTSELQSPCNLVCRLLLEKKKTNGSPYSHD